MNQQPSNQQPSNQQSSKHPSDHSSSQNSDLSVDEQKKPASIPLLQVVLSVLQASFGVQNSRNRERDFTQGKFGVFVAAALIFTTLFVLTIVGIVSMVLPD